MSEPPAELRCPSCQSKHSLVRNTRGVVTGRKIRRKRECLACGWRYRTRETVEPLTEAEALTVLADAQRLLAQLRAQRAA